MEVREEDARTASEFQFLKRLLLSTSSEACQASQSILVVLLLPSSVHLILPLSRSHCYSHSHSH